jgi:ABC-type polysaccharide/polyol phosphate export permease
MPYHLAFIGMSFEEIRDFHPNLALFLARTVNTLGAFQVGIGILAIGIALGAFRRAEPWAWLTLLPALSIVLGRIMLATFRVDAPVKWISLLLALLFLTAMLVPVKDFLGLR